jgi:ATP-dependent RNA helicase SUPV3L1/SUV3
MLGYRQCGERAVRVDILERLADLIRPALSWREASPGEKPAGAFDGRGFVVTQAMTSLTGSAGEDFASILRALGYRMEKRPPLPPKPVVVETVATETPPVEGVADAPADVVAETPSENAAETVEQPVSGDPAPSSALLPEVTPIAASEGTPPVAEDAPVVAEETPVLAEVQPELVDTQPEQAVVAEVASSEAAPEAAAAPEAPAEPQLVEVWRPSGRGEDRRPRHERPRHRHHGPRKDGEQAAAAAPAEGAAGEKREHRNRHHRRGGERRDFRKPAEGAPAQATAEPASAPVEGASAPAPAQEQPRHEPRDRGDRRERFEGKGRDRDRDNKREKFGDREGNRRDDRDRRDRDRGRDKGRDKRDRESGPALRHYATSAAPRDRAADPNSPFAKLAALKEQLAGNRKE